jgi:hypothetical protein
MRTMQTVLAEWGYELVGSECGIILFEIIAYFFTKVCYNFVKFMFW